MTQTMFIGEYVAGHACQADRRFVEADVKIVTGLVEPHFMAGYSGGRKVVAPGIAHQDTITTFHNAGFLEHARSANCTSASLSAAISLPEVSFYLQFGSHNFHFSACRRK